MGQTGKKLIEQNMMIVSDKENEHIRGIMDSSRENNRCPTYIFELNCFN